MTLAWLFCSRAAPLVGRFVDQHGARLILTRDLGLFALVVLLPARATTLTPPLLVAPGLGLVGAFASTVHGVPSPGRQFRFGPRRA